MFRRKRIGCEAEGEFDCLNYLQREIFEKTMPPEDVAAIFVEAQQGEGGYIVPPKGWLKRLQDIAQSYDILLAVDEVQSGIGRTGEWFAHMHHGVEPDIIMVAKGIASGMPISIMMSSVAIMDGWEPGSHASTFGGNPVACAAALATLNVIEEEDLMGNAVLRGNQLHREFITMTNEYSFVKNPRGMGLMRAIDIIPNGKGRHRDIITEQCFERGLILLGCGKNGIRFCPALNVTKEEIDTCVDILNGVLKEYN